MRFILASITVLISLISTEAFSVDIFNTYRWNRKNHQAENGKVDNRQWFEWWYYKIVVPDTNKAYYFVYGVVNPWDTGQTLKGSRSYVGAGDFEKRIILEAKYPVNQFAASYAETSVSLPDGIATDKQFRGHIKEDGNNYSWDIDIEREWSFNAEGWMLGKGLTNIEWYPAQADAKCTGQIVANGEIVRFTDAPCYQDRNWGKSFPLWWTWIVSNKFDEYPETSISVGGGQPKVAGIPSFYQGVCIGLKHKGEVYKFRPTDLDYVSVDINFGNWEVLGISRNRLTKIELVANAPKEAFMDLQFMTPGGEIFHDYEALLGNLEVKLYKRTTFLSRWKLVDTLRSSYTGIEYGSTDTHDVETLFSTLRQLQ